LDSDNLNDYWASSLSSSSRLVAVVEKLTGKDQSRDTGVEGRIILKCAFKVWYMRMCIELNWLKTGSSDELL
jgi:hypothetical protein